MYFAKNIRYLRKLKGMTQEDVAESLGYKSFTTVQKWESGVAEPPFSVMHEIAKLFEIDINRLTYEDIEASDSSPQEGPPPPDPKITQFTELFSQLTDSDKQKVKELAQLLLMAEQAQNGKEGG